MSFYGFRHDKKAREVKGRTAQIRSLLAWVEKEREALAKAMLAETSLCEYLASTYLEGLPKAASDIGAKYNKKKKRVEYKEMSVEITRHASEENQTAWLRLVNNATGHFKVTQTVESLKEDLEDILHEKECKTVHLFPRNKFLKEIEEYDKKILNGVSVELLEVKQSGKLDTNYF